MVHTIYWLLLLSFILSFRYLHSHLSLYGKEHHTCSSNFLLCFTENTTRSEWHEAKKIFTEFSFLHQLFIYNSLRFSSMSAFWFSKAYNHWSCVWMHSLCSIAIITHRAFNKVHQPVLNSFGRQAGLFCLRLSGADQLERPPALRKGRLLEV